MLKLAKAYKHQCLKLPELILDPYGFVLLLLVVCIRNHQKHDYGNYDGFVPNFDMAYKTIKRVSVPNLKAFRPTKTELQAKEVGELSVGKWDGGRSLAHEHGCRNINVQRFSKLWTAVTFTFICVSS